MQYRALLAAINDYGHPRNNLPSCIADLKYVEQLLHTDLKVPSGNIRSLVDKQVTRAAVESGLAWLTEGASEDRRLLFFFSGHGFRRPGSDGSIEEMLVLSDNEFFEDDKLVEASKKAKPGTLTVLLDCCFAGGNDKTFQPAGDFGAFVSIKTWSPPDDYVEKQSAETGKGEAIPIVCYRPFAGRPIDTKSTPSIVFSEAGLTAWPTAIDEGGQTSLNGALLAACLEDELASASSPQTEKLSAFTYALKQVVAGRGLDFSMQEMRDGTDAVLKRLGFRQTPTLKIGTGPIDRSSRFLTLERRAARRAAWIGERSGVMADKFVDALVEPIVERCLVELGRKNYAPAANGADKFVPGLVEIIAPVIVNRVIDELTKKGYAPAGGASSKFFPGSDIIVRELIDRGIRELTKDYQGPEGSKFVDRGTVERIIREALGGGVRGGAKDFSPSQGDKGIGDIAREVLERAARELVERGVRELTKDYQAGSAGGDKFFPGANLIIPVVVDRVIREIAR
jgi:hypothetical protein